MNNSTTPNRQRISNHSIEIPSDENIFVPLSFPSFKFVNLFVGF
jgi:hypothetical protein